MTGWSLLIFIYRSLYNKTKITILVVGLEIHFIIAFDNQTAESHDKCLFKTCLITYIVFIN